MFIHDIFNFVTFIIQSTVFKISQINKNKLAQNPKIKIQEIINLN